MNTVIMICPKKLLKEVSNISFMCAKLILIINICITCCGPSNVVSMYIPQCFEVFQYLDVVVQ